MKFCPIASGSSGNCIFVGSGDTNMLIDAGLSGKKIEAGLSSIDISPEKIDAIFVTHEHSDHIMGAGVLSRRFDIPIYATEDTWSAMNGFIGKLKPYNRRFVYKDENCIVNDILVRPFEIPHDASEPVGYRITIKDINITIATDIGHVTDTVKENIYDSDILLIESNHDIDMLKNGSYPYPLKQRILSDYGHLSNENCARLLIDCMSEKLKYIYLGHLSYENNTPEIAYKTVKYIMQQRKIEFDNNLKMIVANRDTPSQVVKLQDVI